MTRVVAILSLLVLSLGCASHNPSPAKAPDLAAFSSYSLPPAAAASQDFRTTAQLVSHTAPAKGEDSAFLTILRQQDDAPRPPGGRGIELPPSLPGADAPPLRLPPVDEDLSPEERRRRIASFYAPLPDFAPTAPAAPVTGPALSLADLRLMAFQNSPAIQEAQAAVSAAYGDAVQAGAYPNPQVGYQADEINGDGGAGRHGGFLSQRFVTANKLGLDQAAGLAATGAAEAALRQRQFELGAEVARRYYDALTAQERVRLGRAMAQLSEDVYQAQIALVQGGEAAVFEPIQLRAAVVQSRLNVAQAENDYQAAWRRLTATLGMPHLPPAPLVGAIEQAAPHIDFEAALRFMLSRHSELAEAQARIEEAAWQLNRERVQPIPDLNVMTSVLQDLGSQPSRTTVDLQVGIELPIFNKNRGAIFAASARLAQAEQRLADRTNQLAGRLADALRRYMNSRMIVQSYRDDILPSQAQAFRGVYGRYREVGDPADFAQVVVAEQALAQSITQYLAALQDQWQAAADLAELLQVEDLAYLEGFDCPPPVVME